MHEILTLQLGHRANFLATHFWNAQVSLDGSFKPPTTISKVSKGNLADCLKEAYFTYGGDARLSSINHDILFRPGIGADGGETFTPRTLIYDLKGGFGGLRKLGGLYDQSLSMNGAEQERNARGVWYVQRSNLQEPSLTCPR